MQCLIFNDSYSTGSMEKYIKNIFLKIHHAKQNFQMIGLVRQRFEKSVQQDGKSHISWSNN